MGLIDFFVHNPSKVLVGVLLVALFGADATGAPRVPAFETIIDESEPFVLRTSPTSAAMVFVQASSVFVPLAPPLPETPLTSPEGLEIERYRSGIAVARISSAG